MQFDNNAFRKIATMNDAELRQTLTAVAKENKINLPNISDAELAKIRIALSAMSPADLEKLKKSLQNRERQ